MFSLGCNYWSRSGPRMWTRFNPEWVTEELMWAKQMNLDTIRWFLYWPDMVPAPSEINSSLWSPIEQFLDQATALSLKTYPTLLVGHMSGENWDPVWRQGRDLWSDPLMVDQEAWFMETVVKHLQHHPAVAGWILTNEWPLYAGVTEPPIFRKWADRMTKAVRHNDSARRPVFMGDGLWNAMGSQNGIPVVASWQLFDGVGPHIYPESVDPLDVAMAPYLAVKMAMGPQPVLLEEFGTTDAFGSRTAQAGYYRSALVGSLLGGAEGAWAWCLSDFTLDKENPYRHHPFELTFGLVDAQGEIKATGRVMQEFRAIADSFGTPDFDPVAVVVPALQDGSVPFERYNDQVVLTDLAERQLRALAQGGINPRVVREIMPQYGEPAPTYQHELNQVKAVWLLAPRISENLRQELGDFVKHGGNLYIPFSYTSWFPDLEELLGVVWTGSYGTRDQLSAGTKTFVPPVGEAIAFSIEKELDWAPVTATTARVSAWITNEESKVPLVFTIKKGQGKILFARTTMEKTDAVDPFYQWLITEMEVIPRIRFAERGVQVGVSKTGNVLVMNHNESAVRARPLVDSPWQLEDGSMGGVKSLELNAHEIWQGKLRVR